MRSDWRLAYLEEDGRAFASTSIGLRFVGEKRTEGIGLGWM
jgi:hypothetical protein